MTVTRASTVLILGLAIFASAGIGAGWLDSPQWSSPMSSTEYSSPILTYQYILLLDIVDERPDTQSREVSPGGQSLRRRDVLVSARVLEYLKTPPDTSQQASMQFIVSQREPEDGWYADDYGPWSEIDLQAHPRLLVFAATSHQPTPLGVALGGDDVMLVPIPNPRVPFAREDVKLALAFMAQVGHPMVLASDRIRAAILADRSQLGPLMGGFLLESARGRADFTADQAFSFLVELLASRDAQPLFRKPILIGCVNQLAIAPGPRSNARAQFARAMVAILDEPSEVAAELQLPIVQTYLRTTLFDADWTPLVGVGTVFADPSARYAFEAHLTRRGIDPDTAEKLCAWLGQ